MSIANELIAGGGPSAPAWAFFSAISLALIGVLAQQLKARSDLKQLKESSERVENEATQAHQSANEAKANTENVSNGFARRMDTKLDELIASVQATRDALETQKEAFRAHLEWHLEKEK